MKFGIVIVTYNPNISLLENNIKNYSNISNYVVIVNNSSTDIKVRSKCSVINLHKNKGIAFAQNKGVESLLNAGVDYVFFFDQDSIVENDYFYKMLELWKKIEKENKKIGALCPSIYDRNQGVVSHIDIVDNNTSVFCDSKIAVCNTLPISSGMLTKVDIFNEVGGNISGMFIDWIDFDYDIRLILNGFNVYTTSLVCIDHAVGNATKHRFFHKEIAVSNHAPLREYYFFRNGVYLVKKDGKKFKPIRKMVVNMLLRRIVFVFYESNKCLRIKYIIRGLYDGFRGKLNEV